MQYKTEQILNILSSPLQNVGNASYVKRVTTLDFPRGLETYPQCEHHVFEIQVEQNNMQLKIRGREPSVCFVVILKPSM